MMKLRWALALSVFAIVNSFASAQNTGKPWGFFSLKPELTEAPPGAPPLDMRANAKQTLQLFVVNPTEDTPTVTISVSAGGKQIATGEARMTGRGLQKVALTPVAAPAPVPGAPVNEAGTVIPPDATTGKMQLFVSVANKNRTEEAANVSVQAVLIKNPTTFLGPISANYSGATNQLTVTIKGTDIQGPPVPIELVLTPQDVPGLQKGELKGLTRGTLTEQQKDLTLFAADLALTPGSAGIGKATLTVDGIERAVVLKGSFKVQPGGKSDDFLPDRETDLRILAPAAARPGQDITAKIEAANIPDDAKMTFSFVPASGTGTVVGPTYTRNSSRDQWAAVKVDDGALAVTTSSKDWAFKLDTRGMYGPYTLKTTANTNSGIKEAISTIIFDDTAPKDVRFLAGNPKVLPIKGRQYDVRVVGVDNDSKIAKVEFFVGAEPPPPSPDGKDAAGVKPVIGVIDSKAPADAPVWVGRLSLPEKAGPLPVFVRFTNNVAMPTVEKMDLNVIEPPPGWIKGQVKFGNAIQQKDVEVWLVDKDGKTVKTAGLNKDAYFEITDLKPADYQLVARRKVAAKPLMGTQTITVKEGPDPTPALIILHTTP